MSSGSTMRGIGRGKGFDTMRIALIAVLALVSTVAHADVRGLVRVIDGDTLKIGETTYRLHGIDAPEHGQQCNRPGGGKWSCGKHATDALTALVQGKAVKCEPRGKDGYGRVVAVCSAGGLELNDTLVRIGFAWAFRSYSNDYVSVEDAARAAGVGIWRAPTETAKIYRARRWKVAEQTAPKGCPFCILCQ